MSQLLHNLRERQDLIGLQLGKAEFAESARFAHNFALVNKDAVSPLALYADSLAVCGGTSERDGVSHWTISTQAMDRDGDILIPMGCLPEIECFKLNPVVDYDHRRDYKLPIGKSLGSAGLPVTVTEKAVTASCLHHHETQFADEVARLVFKGMLKGCSVSFVPVHGEKIAKAHDAEKQKVTPRFKFSRWQLTAWSICPVGINPEALRMELSAGWMKSELVKSLSPLAQKPQIWSPGFDPAFDKETQMIDITTVNKSDIASVRFHKATFDADKAVAWLGLHGFDASLATDNQKSVDYVQDGEASEKTAKVEDGIYVVYKAFPPKKKQKDGDSDEQQSQKKKKMPGSPPETPVSNKPAPKLPGKPVGGKPAIAPAGTDNPEDTDSTDDEIEDRDPDALEDQAAVDEEASDQNIMDDEEVDPNAMETDLGLGNVGQNSDQGGGQTPTHAGQSFIDLARHMKAEINYCTQAMAKHDHDGIKQYLAKLLPARQKELATMMMVGQKMFPGLDIEGLSEQLDDLADEPDDLDFEADPTSPVDDDLVNKMKSMGPDDWDEVAIRLALDS